MNSIRFAEGLKVLPLLAPQNITTSAAASYYADLDGAHWATVVVSLGAWTSDSTDTVVFTVEASTAGSSNATESAIAFTYRLSSAVDTDLMGAITAATSAGVTLTATDDNKVLVIDIDPAVVAAVGTDHKFFRVVATPSSNNAGTQLAMCAFLEPRYPANLSPNAT